MERVLGAKKTRTAHTTICRKGAEKGRRVDRNLVEAKQGERRSPERRWREIVGGDSVDRLTGCPKDAEKAQH